MNTSSLPSSGESFSGRTVRFAVIALLTLTIFRFLGSVAASGSDQLAVDAIEIWDQRMSDVHAKPVKIEDQIRVTALGALIRNAPGEWKRGSFTAPEGDLRFVFMKTAHVVEIIGVGPGFLVRYVGRDWESKGISAQLEGTLRSLGQKQETSQTTEPTAPTRAGST